MKKKILVAFWAIVFLVLFGGLAHADSAKGVPTTFTRDEPSRVLPVEEILLAGPAGVDMSLPSARKCRWIKGPTSKTSSTIVTALMPTVLEGCGSVVSVGGGVYGTSLPESSFSSSRLVCDG